MTAPRITRCEWVHQAIALTRRRSGLTDRLASPGAIVEPLVLRGVAAPTGSPRQVALGPADRKLGGKDEVMFQTMVDGARTARGVIRSLRIYHGDRARRDALDRHYRRFVAAGDLVFDIGSHVGDRVGSFRRLGARVIAVEPQPALARTLRLFYGRDRAVRIVEAAVGRRTGAIPLRLNLDNPTVSTASEAFIAAAHDAPGWHEQRWQRTVDVPLTTLDALIAQHGRPRFIKIDVEGYEAEALAGLSQPVAALSFEFTTIQRSLACACVERCVAIGYNRFEASLGESLMFVHDRKLAAGEISEWLMRLPVHANSGDIYATCD